MDSMDNSQIDELRQAIKTLETQRTVLGDAVVDASIEAINQQIAGIETLAGTVPQQRKLATILFTDIVGHTKLIQDLDPEDNMTIIDGALVRLAAVVESHGGRIARYQGDGFKAIFGLPSAKESDPHNAVQAGLAIIAEAKGYAHELEAEWGIAGFNVRVGIDTGLVVSGGITEAEDTIKGLVVNLAARLESAAPPGRVLISQHTYQHVRGMFEVESQQPIIAKGFPDPVPVYLVTRIAPRRFRQGTRGMEGIETKMVGRNSQLQQLQESYETAVRRQETRIITITGDAGVGKSRLLFEFENWLEQQPKTAQTFRGRASPQTRGSAQYLWRDLLAAHFQILDSDPLDILQNKFARGLSAILPAEGEMKAHVLGIWLGYEFKDSRHLAAVIDEPEQLKRRATLYLGDFFSAIASEGPLVIMLEDIHWADSGSLDTVLELVRKRPQLPLLIIGLARPSLYERLPAWGESLAAHRRLNLTPLTALDTNALVAEILRLLDPQPQSLLNLVSSRAEGNPFYAEELIKMLIDNGAIVTGREKWHFIPEQLDALDVPATLIGVLQARLDRLQPIEKEALQQASVIGRIFWDKTLDALPNDGSVALPVLQAKEFIYTRANTAFAKTVEFIFKHALLRDVTYESVLLRLRRDYHARIGHWIEENAGDRLDEFAGVIAEHFTQAGANERASYYWERAGDTAFKTGTYASARDAFELALELAPQGDPLHQAELGIKLAATLPILQEMDKAEQMYRHALTRLEGNPQPETYKRWHSARLNILLGLMDVLYFQKQPDAMSLLREQTEQLLEDVGSLKQQIDYYQRLGQLAFLQNRWLLPDNKFYLIRKAMDYARESGSELLMARTRFHLGFHLTFAGNRAEAEGLLEQALLSAQEFGDSWLQLQSLSYIFVCYRFQGNRQRAAERLPALDALATEIGFGSYVGVSQSCSAWLHYHAGERPEAKLYAEQALESWTKIAYPIQWLAHWILLALALEQQRIEDAVQAARAMIDAKQQKQPEETEDLLRTAVAAWEAEDKTAAESYLHRAVKFARASGYL